MIRRREQIGQNGAAMQSLTKCALLVLCIAALASGFVLLLIFVFGSWGSPIEYAIAVGVITLFVFPMAWVLVLDTGDLQRLIRKRSSRCVACGYSLIGLGESSPRCPECGALIER
jgi:membrane protease YdiL (CAAX protease family)